MCKNINGLAGVVDHICEISPLLLNLFYGITLSQRILKEENSEDITVSTTPAGKAEL
jgi:hypothetical protein